MYPIRLTAAPPGGSEEITEPGSLHTPQELSGKKVAESGSPLLAQGLSLMAPS